ncbi:MAG TPA: type II toxin-antitoxin system VapC family toxin [Rhizomicrobium sp.]|jgi:predicted nucleic acid-binding protein
MPALVLDASITLSIVLPDETDDRAIAAWEIAAARGALVPSHWPLEVANGLVMAQRRGRISDRDRQNTIADLMAFTIVIDGHTADVAWLGSSILAGRYRLTVYDAAYLELAARSGLSLATLDDELADAAGKAGVPIIK